ncbi:hypothetical protein BCR35DRAFT_25688 [Leucosporidium creatinivorum]|uniref:Uncharacterized protein n=1 Tax=Leucosporidium creatinivorum TaxID=106004 RepID=A0A1Y2CRR4_9BASI|nr:hypothetical protein BCR35DRAFT_25688 [Leucosporidium creatinivorum]
MPEILKLMSLGSVKRSQPFMAHSLIFNNRTLITPENETEIWFCHHSILALINLEGEGGESYDERFHLAISDVKAIEMENAPEGDEDFIVIEMILNSPPHLGSTLLNDPPAGEQGHHRLIIKTTTRGSAFGILKKTMEERAWRYPALTPHPTSSGTSTSSRPTILNPPPPPLAGAQPSINGHAPAHKDKKPRSSQAGPIVGVFKGPPPPPPQSVNGDLDTPVFEKDEESQTIKRGKVLAAMAELPEDLASEAGGSKGEESGEEEEEDGVGELVSGQVEQVVQEEEESAEKMVQERQQEVDAGELSSDLSSIEDSDKEVEVKVNATKTRQPSKVSSSRKSTTTTTTTAKSVVVNVGSPLPPPRAPSKRRSPRLTPPPPKQQQQQRQARELTESIEEESLDRNPKPPPVVDEIVDVDSESLPNPRARKAAAPRPSSTNPENKEKEKTVSSRRPKRTSTKAKEVVVQSAVAEPAAIAVPLRKRVRSPSPSSIPVPIASPPRQKTKTTIMDEPAYPKRRKVTDASPVDEEAPYETTLEVEEKKSSGRYTLQEKKKSGVPTPRKKYGRERKERKVAEGVKMSKVGAKGKGKKKQEESASEDEDEDEEQEVVVSESKGKKKAAESKKPATDFDSLPHVKPKKTNVKDTLKTTTKSKMKAKTAASDAPISASTTKSTKLAASRATRAAEKKEAIERATTKKKAASKSKKAETFSQ